MNIKHSFKPRAHARGLTLIELMISIFLGLLIIGAAITVFASNRQTYRATESLGRIQENSRTAFELMARDIREAAGNACEQNIPVVNVLNAPTTNWYTDFSGGIRGYDGGTAMQGLATGTADGQRIAGTDAIELKSSVASAFTIVNHAPPNNAQFTLNTTDHTLNEGDIAMVCDFDHASIFQITNASPGTNVNVVHNSGNTHVPGNSTKCLSVSGVCGPETYSFGCRNGEATGSASDPCPGDEWPSTIAKLRATRWFIGNNPRGGRSLYQSSVQNIGANLSVTNNEIVEGVRDMQLTYLEANGTEYDDASAPPDWTTVAAVRIELTFEGEDRVGVDGGVLQRQLFHTVALRNRAP